MAQHARPNDAGQLLRLRDHLTRSSILAAAGLRPLRTASSIQAFECLAGMVVRSTAESPRPGPTGCAARSKPATADGVPPVRSFSSGSAARLPRAATTPCEKMMCEGADSEFSLAPGRDARILQGSSRAPGDFDGRENQRRSDPDRVIAPVQFLHAFASPPSLLGKTSLGRGRSRPELRNTVTPDRGRLAAPIPPDAGSASCSGIAGQT